MGSYYFGALSLTTAVMLTSLLKSDQQKQEIPETRLLILADWMFKAILLEAAYVAVKLGIAVWRTPAWLHAFWSQTQSQPHFEIVLALRILFSFVFPGILAWLGIRALQQANRKMALTCVVVAVITIVSGQSLGLYLFI
jgi:hypothetical protein